MPRIDIPAKVNGSAVYGTDVRLPGMRYAAVSLAPVFGGKVKSYDRASATVSYTHLTLPTKA